MNIVYKALSYDHLHTASLSPRAEKELDPQVMKWLKRKFTSISEQESDAAAKNIQTLSNADFRHSLETSSIKDSSNHIIAMFDKVDEWNFDVFTLSELTEGNTLFITTYTLFHKYDFLTKFKVPEEVLVAFLREVQNGYKTNPYHNSMHSADVVQIIHYIIYKGGLNTMVTIEETLAALTSAMVHDLGHPGLNNAFQVNTGSYLATLYNDRSVLENHHCAQAFELLRSPQFNILANLTKEQRKVVRDSMVDMTLSTDMGEHGRIFGQFKARVETEQPFTSKEDIKLILAMSIKFADVSNPTRPTDLAVKWAKRIEEEFYAQGDKEKELAIPISPFMDRSKSSLPKLQLTFITKIVTPMLEQMCKVLPKMNFAFQYTEANKKYWETR